jgi:RNA polymerase sigma-54 factor
MASRPQSLHDYLTDQLTFLDANAQQMNLLRFLISHIDENGYLKVAAFQGGEAGGDPIAEIARAYGQGVTAAQVEEALQMVQKLEPLGVGARDLKECLLLQLTPETPHRDILRVLILNHLEDIQHNRLPVIQRKTGFEIKEIKEAIETLKHLNPKPGSRFASDNIPYVVPDIVVERTEDGEYEVRLLDDWTPNIYISRRFMELYRDKGADPKTKEYLKRKIQSAQWLMESIEQRRNTLEKVTRAIIKHQRAFLDKGPEHIEPLNEAGYPVARRTVTKYRKMLNIPSSRQRKDWAQ